MTVQNTEAILTRITKLLALSKSSNPNEAAAAAAKASELIYRYNTQQTQLEAAGQVKSPLKLHSLDLGTGKAMEWRRDLVFSLARYNFSRAYSHEGAKRMTLIATQTNMDAITQLYSWLGAELQRLADRSFVDYRMAGGDIHAQTYKTSFLLGAVQGVRKQLHDQWEASQTATDTTALVVVKDQELDDAQQDLLGKVGSRKSANPNDVLAYVAGVQAGRNVRIHQQVAG